MATTTTRVFLEVGRTWVFATALDWPGWCRRGKGEEGALDELSAYAQRYRFVAGPGFAPGDLHVLGRVPGNATTDFGAPDVRGPWDDEPFGPGEADRQTALVEAAWRCFDEFAGAAPAELRKGPRGGGRDRDAVVEHVREAERSLGRKAGARVPPGTPWADQRAALLEVLQRPPAGTDWPPRYAIRRLTWHVLDHAWEIQDKSN